MENEDTELIKVVKPKKRSLLEKYGILVDRLSFEHISQSTDTKELERILIILRSGEEGVYPDLTKHAEDRLTVLKPSSSLLRKTEPALKREMLEPSEREELENDINSWMCEMKNREKDLAEGKASRASELFAHPDVRQGVQKNVKKSKATTDKTAKPKRISSCDYAAWDKFDADTEMNRIDLQEERRQIDAKEVQRRQREAAKRGKEMGKEVIVNKLSLTGTEMNVMAVQEREKGNEAFRAGDYEEALQRYSASIAVDSNPIAYNNRAMALIKLCRFEDAVKDCNTVLSSDCANIKALLRRAFALERLEKRSEALADYESVLKLEADNKTAIAAVNRLRKPCQSKRIRMKITEEHANENKDYVNTMSSNSNKRNVKASKKLCMSENIGTSLCFCDRAPGSSKNSNPLPHIKSDYCTGLGSVQKSPYAKSDKPSKPTFNMQFKESAANSRLGKPKSIFSYVSEPNKPSSVIIEEIPNDTPENINVPKKAQTDSTAKKKKSNAAHGKQADKTRDKVKATDSSNFKDPKSHGDIKIQETETNNISLKLEASYSSRKREEPLDKDKGNIDVPQKRTLEISENFDDVKTPYQYFRMWQSGKDSSDLKQHAQLLRSTTPDDLGLRNKLDSPMFSAILRCLKEYFCTTEDLKLLCHFLRSLSAVKRFQIVVMFIDEADTKVLEDIMQFLEDEEVEEVCSLREKYNVKKQTRM